MDTVNHHQTTSTPTTPTTTANLLSHSNQLIQGLIHSVTESPLNVCLTAICVGLVYLIYKSTARNDKNSASSSSTSKPPLKPLPKGDMTLAELRKFDGKSEESEGRVLLAVNREIYDVTRGSRFYGPEGPYANLAGRDATRALALFAVDAVKDEWDDYSDLLVSQMATVTEWLEQFKEKYEYVGKLVKTEAEKATPVEPADEEPDDKEDEVAAAASAGTTRGLGR